MTRSLGQTRLRRPLTIVPSAAMQTAACPRTTDLTPEEFRRHGHQLIDWLADYQERLSERPVMARTKPGEIRDLVSTGLGVLGLSWQSSPAITEVEEVVTDWLRQMLGLTSAFSGVIQDTASTSTLVALISARERSTGFALARGGLQGESRRLRVYVSAHAHSSVDKGALLAGFGRDNIRLVPHDAEFAMRADALADMVAEDLARGDLPSAVVATVGTTATTALDPVGAIADIARRHGLWLHVDAAMAGSAMILPE